MLKWSVELVEARLLVLGVRGAPVGADADVLARLLGPPAFYLERQRVLTSVFDSGEYESHGEPPMTWMDRMGRIRDGLGAVKRLWEAYVPCRAMP